MFRKLHDGFYVSPQLSREDFRRAREQGFASIIDNRPDGEDPTAPQSSESRQLAETHSMRWHYLPIGHAGLEPSQITSMRAIIESDAAPVLAYCRSGTRSAMLWGLAMAGRMPIDEIIARGAAAGYDLSPLASAMETLAGDDQEP